MYTLYYNYAELPQKVRIISKPLALDHTICPNEFTYHNPNFGVDNMTMYDNCVDMSSIFKLSEANLFDHIYIYLNEYNMAYYYAANNKKIDVIGWIDVLQFVDGGHYSNGTNDLE